MNLKSTKIYLNIQTIDKTLIKSINNLSSIQLNMKNPLFYLKLVQNILQICHLPASYSQFLVIIADNNNLQVYTYFPPESLFILLKTLSLKVQIDNFSGQQQYYNQFYSLALMQPLFYSQGSAFRSLQDSQKSSDQTRLSKELLLIAAINQQFQLTQHLIQYQYKLSQELKKEKQSSDSGQSSLVNNQNTNKRMEIQEQQDFKFASDKLDDSSSHRSSKQQEPLTRLRIKKVFKYDIDSESQQEPKQIRKCQTKNIIKNFIKSIFNFIRKHKKYVERVLQQNKIQQNSFMSVMQSLNGKVNTILQLRQLWTQKPYNEIFRIISAYFLRKYSLRHIFHSRISNHQIHLKYRHKLLKSIERPEQFTSLKDF